MRPNTPESEEPKNLDEFVAWALGITGLFVIAIGALRLSMVVWMNMFVEAIQEAAKNTKKQASDSGSQA